jgi:hypothetical protein
VTCDGPGTTEDTTAESGVGVLDDAGVRVGCTVRATRGRTGVDVYGLRVRAGGAFGADEGTAVGVGCGMGVRVPAAGVVSEMATELGTVEACSTGEAGQPAPNMATSISATMSRTKMRRE